MSHGHIEGLKIFLYHLKSLWPVHFLVRQVRTLHLLRMLSLNYNLISCPFLQIPSHAKYLSLGGKGGGKGTAFCSVFGNSQFFIFIKRSPITKIYIPVTQQHFIHAVRNECRETRAKCMTGRSYNSNKAKQTKLCNLPLAPS